MACLEATQKVECFANKLPDETVDPLTEKSYGSMVKTFDAAQAEEQKQVQEQKAKDAEDWEEVKKKIAQLEVEIKALRSEGMVAYELAKAGGKGASEELEPEPEEKNDEEPEAQVGEEPAVQEGADKQEEAGGEEDDEDEGEEDDPTYDPEAKQAAGKKGGEGEESEESDGSDMSEEDLSEDDEKAGSKAVAQREAFDAAQIPLEKPAEEDVEMQEARDAAAAGAEDDDDLGSLLDSASDDDDDDGAGSVSNFAPDSTYEDGLLAMTDASAVEKSAVADHVVAGALQEPVVQRTAASLLDQMLSDDDDDDDDDGDDDGEEGEGGEEEGEEDAEYKESPEETAAREAEEKADDLADGDADMTAADEEGGMSDSADDMEIGTGTPSVTMPLGTAIVLTLKGVEGNPTMAVDKAKETVKLALRPLAATFRKIAYVERPKTSSNCRWMRKLLTIEPFFLLLKDGTDKSYDEQVQEKAKEKFADIHGMTSDTAYKWTFVPFYEQPPEMPAVPAEGKALSQFSSFGIWADTKLWRYKAHDNGKTVTVTVFIEPLYFNQWKDYRAAPIPKELRYNAARGCNTLASVGAALGQGVAARQLRRAPPGHTRPSPFGARTAPIAVSRSTPPKAGSSGPKGPEAPIGKDGKKSALDPRAAAEAAAAAEKEEEKPAGQKKLEAEAARMKLLTKAGGKAWAETVVVNEKMTAFLKSRKNLNEYMLRVARKDLLPDQKAQLGLLSVEIEPPIVLTDAQAEVLANEPKFKSARDYWDVMPYNEKLVFVDGLDRTAIGGVMMREYGAVPSNDTATKLTGRAKEEEEKPNEV